MKIAILHRYPFDQIKETNAAFLYLIINLCCGSHVDVITFKKFDRLNDKIKFLKSLCWLLIAPLKVVGRGYDTIYCDDSFPFYAGLVKLVSPRSRVVKRMGDFHLMYYVSGALYKLLHWFELQEWKKLDLIIAISDVMADKIREEVSGRCIPPSVAVVPDPVDPKQWPDSKWGKCADKTTVMFHGLLTRNKNVEMLLGAASFLLGIDFFIIGEGPHKQALQKQAPENVHFLGWQAFDDMPNWISQCDIGVALRSDNPGNEYVVTSPFLQYGAMSKPCLVTRRKVFGDYEWQFGSVRELVEKIQKLLPVAEEEGDKLYHYVMKHHNAKDVAEKLWLLLSY